MVHSELPGKCIFSAVINVGKFFCQLIKNMLSRQIDGVIIFREMATYGTMIGLQLMAIAVRAAVPLAFSHIHANEGKKLREGLKQQNTTPLKLLTDCVIEGISLYPLQAILEKTREIIGWGYYYAIYIGSSQSTLHLNLRCEEALSCLENGNPKGFADCLFDCYCYLFQTVRDFLVGQKISGVGHLKIPD